MALCGFDKIIAFRAVMFFPLSLSMNTVSESMMEHYISVTVLSNVGVSSVIFMFKKSVGTQKKKKKRSTALQWQLNVNLC